jgi:hypothetical protein
VELKRALYNETCLLATLLERMSSEAAMEKVIPPEIEIITRRVLLDRLSALGLREGLEPYLLDLLLAPDGHWTAEQKARAIPALECLAVLRWVLGLSHLRSLSMDPGYNFNEVRTLHEIKEPENLLALPTWDLRLARDLAEDFFQRCWAELLARRMVTEVPDADIDRAMEIRSNIAERGCIGDYLIGSTPIAELQPQLLWLATRRSYTRWGMLSVLVEVTCGDAPPDAVRRFLSRFFAPEPAKPAPAKIEAEQPA